MSTNVNIVENPMFYTPKSQDELLNYIERYSASERVAALTAMGLTWNMLAYLVKQAKESDTE